MPRLSPRVALWSTRLLWLLTTVVVSLAIEGTAVLAAWWVAAGVALVALTVCGPLALTIIRMIAPAAVLVSVAGIISGPSAVAGVAAIACALLASLITFLAETGEAMLQVSAYGDERRLPLRVPAAMQPLLVISWLLWCATLLTAGLLFADDKRVAATIVLAIGAVLSWPVGRRLHRFSNRWLVSVPAGVVVHDSLMLAETLMVLRANIAHAHLALADTNAFDLTGPAAGHALELEFREDVTLLLAATHKQPKGVAIHARAILVAPSRPGRSLRVLAERKISVG